MIKAYCTTHGILIIHKDCVLEFNAGVTRWTHEEFLQKCNTRVTRSLLVSIYGEEIIQDAISVVEELIR